MHDRKGSQELHQEQWTGSGEKIAWQKGENVNNIQEKSGQRQKVKVQINDMVLNTEKVGLASLE